MRGWNSNWGCSICARVDYAEAARTIISARGAAYLGYWLVDDHMAELLGTVGKYDEAIRLYERVMQETPRPELQQAFGELYVAMGEKKNADVWFDRALEGFLSASESGGVHYYHHLVDFYSDVREDPPRAVEWATKDYDLRPNYATQGALGWAFYRDGRLRKAERMMDEALASEFADSASVCEGGNGESRAAGRMGASDSLSRQAFAMNPHHDGFHAASGLKGEQHGTDELHWQSVGGERIGARGMRHKWTGSRQGSR